MRMLYTILIQVYGVMVFLASLFNRKAQLWVKGRKHLFHNLELEMNRPDRSSDKLVWFHVSSLGEFEQGRPVIEEFRKRRPDDRILLTFFSPSGYEIRKHYDQADIVCYLPLDTPGHVRRWLDIVKPDSVFFVKYDFWFNFLHGLRKKDIPVYYISVVLRPDHYFFRWYGAWFRSQLKGITHFFVQDEATGTLLKKTGISQVTVTGDTRFDRVYAIAATARRFRGIEDFIAGMPVFVAGSTWKEDEEILFPFIRKYRGRVRFIIAPHDPSATRVGYISERSGVETICYSALSVNYTGDVPVLIIDSVGILSQVYQYATVAYIGGGFGAGIHNIQEPVTFGVPVLFGPKYTRFKEAVDLVALGGATRVTDAGSLESAASSLLSVPGVHGRASQICKNYVESSRGATEKIMEELGRREE